jgi:uncharacterized protein
MKWLNIITLLLVIVGGINWLLVGIGGYEMDIVANLLGGAEREKGMLAKVVYILVGLSALYQLMPLFRSFGTGETAAQANR